MSDIIITPETQDVLDAINSNSPDDQFLFLTGNAGSGKSTIIRHWLAENEAKEKPDQKRVVILAPTGQAALNLKGQTIHSFCKLDIGFFYVEQLKKKWERSENSVSRLDVVFVDEVSMVTPLILDALDQYLRICLEKPRPFGGCKVVVIGDLKQLAPIVTDREAEPFYQLYQTKYFFSAKVEVNWRILNLTENYRQTDQDFIAALNDFGHGNPCDQSLEYINRATTHEKQEQNNLVILTPTNAAARKHNMKMLARLKSEELTFTGTLKDYKGNRYFNSLGFPTEQDIKIKPGAQVLMCTNSSCWANGTAGVFIGMRDKDFMEILLSTGQTAYVDRFTWQTYEYKRVGKTFEKTVSAEFTQFPVKLGWAITIHKSQGMSLDRVFIDIGRGFFAHGQAYCALSRVKKFKNMTLSRQLKPTDPQFDPLVEEILWQMNAN